MTPAELAEAAWHALFRDCVRDATRRYARAENRAVSPMTDQLFTFLEAAARRHPIAKDAPDVCETSGTMADDEMSSVEVAAELDCSRVWACSLLREGALKDASWVDEKRRGKPRMVRRADFERWRSECSR